MYECRNRYMDMLWVERRMDEWINRQIIGYVGR